MEDESRRKSATISKKQSKSIDCTLKVRVNQIMQRKPQRKKHRLRSES